MTRMYDLGYGESMAMSLPDGRLVRIEFCGRSGNDYPRIGIDADVSIPVVRGEIKGTDKDRPRGGRAK